LTKKSLTPPATPTLLNSCPQLEHRVWKDSTGAPQLGHLRMFPTFSTPGFTAGAAPPAGVPQDGQNFALLFIFAPQFAQKAINISFNKRFRRLSCVHPPV
jgi:hypothetical protein